MSTDDPEEEEAEGPERGRVAVLAVGGNALLPPDQEGTPREQTRNARRFARRVATLVREGYRVVVVHGNGPQVGRERIRSEEASTKVPERPLDVSGAATQGTMGYRLSVAIRDALRREGLERPVSALLTQVLVRPDDPAFEQPTKPVGPVVSSWRARQLRKQDGRHLVEEPGRGWREVVASPKPVDVVGFESVETLVDAGHVVLAGGGGGVPVVVDERGDLRGVEGVVDKDHTAALIGGYLGAGLFVLLTGVDRVYANFGQTDQRPLDRVSREELRELTEQGQFPAGSMGPKVRAVLDFLDEGGEAAAITSEDKLAAALADRDGTRVTRRANAGGLRQQLPLFEGGPPPAGGLDAPDPSSEDPE